MDKLEKRVSGSGNREFKMREQGELREFGGWEPVLEDSEG